MHVVNEPEVLENVGQKNLIIGPKEGESDNVPDGVRATNVGDIISDHVVKKI